MPPTFLFDVDGTLYPNGNGYMIHTRKNAWQYLVDKGFPGCTDIKAAERVWRSQFDIHHQSLKAVKSLNHTDFSEREFLAVMRNGFADFSPNPDLSLIKTLTLLKQKYPDANFVVFSNAVEFSLYEILDALGVRSFFPDHVIFGSDFLGDVCKPELAAFEKVFRQIGLDINDSADCSNVVFFEDSYKNLTKGRELGFKTVFVRSVTAKEESANCDNFDAVVDDVGKELVKNYPQLFESPEFF